MIQWNTAYLHLPDHSEPRKKCNHCNRKASQWLRNDETRWWSSRCHRHRLKTADLPDGSHIISKVDVRIIWKERVVMDVMFE
jgi:hypothetical protein